jgi:hypothetical protein
MTMIVKSMLTTLLLATAVFMAQAQDWFSEYERETLLDGYIIGIAGDTIHGQVRYDYPVVMQKRVAFFQSPRQQEPKIYQPGDIRGYGMKDRRWISTQVIMDTYEGPYPFNRFGLVESIPGPLALVRIFEEKDKHRKKLNSEEAEIIYRNIPYTREGGSFDHVYIKKNEEPAMAVSVREFRKSFPNQILKYVGDYEELKGEIENKSWGWKDLDKIVNEYNRWYLSRFRGER